MVRRNVDPATDASLRAPVLLPRFFLTRRKHVREAPASRDYRRASRRFETPLWPPHTFLLLRKRDRGNDVRETNSDRARGSCGTARLLYRSVRISSRSSRGVNWQQMRAAPVLPFVSPLQSLRQNVPPQQGMSYTTGAQEHTQV